MLIYFLCRYSMWLAVLGVIIALDMTAELNCQALYTFNQIFGEIGIGSASALLMLRTIAVWGRSLWIAVPLCVLHVGQWGVLMHAVTTVRADWNTQADACVITDAGTITLDLIYIYTMSFDFIVLVTTIIGLTRLPGRSKIWTIIFRDGAIYFLVAFGSNAFPAVFVLLNLNPSMNIMFSVPAAVAAATVACRSFVRLSSFQNRDTYVDRTPAPASNQGGSTLVGSKPSSKRQNRGRHNDTMPETLVIHMDTYATHEYTGYSVGEVPSDRSLEHKASFPASHLSFDA